MRDLGRQLSVARLLTALTVLLPHVFLWARPGWALTLTAAVVAVELRCAWATAVQIRGLRSGDLGEVMYVSGERIPLRVLQAIRRWEPIEAVVGFAAYGAVLLATWGSESFVWASLMVVACGSLLAVFTLQRMSAWRTHDALVALMQQDPGAAMKAIARLERWGPRFAAAAEGLKAQALAQLGDTERARRLLEDRWTGSLDAHAASLMLARIGSGDLSLADRWMAVSHPSDRYHRYLRALVAGNLALARSDAQGVWAAVRPVQAELPDYYRRELVLLDAAARQIAGDPDGARETLQPLGGVEHDRWRAAGQPRLWRLLEDAWSGRPTTELPEPYQRPVPGPAVAPVGEVGDAFAPPAEDPPPAPRRRSQTVVGALPAEWVGIGTQRTGRSRVAAVAATVLVVGLTALLLLLMLLLGSTGRLGVGELALGSVVAGLASVVALLVGSTEGLRRRLQRSGPGALLSDDTGLSEAPLWVWWLWGAVPLAATMLLFVVIPPLIEVVLTGRALSLVICVPLGLLGVQTVRSRLHVLRAVAAAHFAEPEAALVASTPLRGAALSWRALAQMLAGQPDAAAETLAAATVFGGHPAQLASWLAAARGEVDLDRLLEVRAPEAAGPMFRHEVTLRLAALQAGRADRVLGRTVRGEEAADALPNRFGGALHRLNLEVLRREAPDRAAAYSATHASQIALGRWVERCWPAVVTPADER